MENGSLENVNDDPLITVITADGKELCCTKSLLTSKSNYFKTKLSERWGGADLTSLRVSSDFESMKLIFDVMHYNTRMCSLG